MFANENYKYLTRGDSLKIHTAKIFVCLPFRYCDLYYKRFVFFFINVPPGFYFCLNILFTSYHDVPFNAGVRTRNKFKEAKNVSLSVCSTRRLQAISPLPLSLFFASFFFHYDTPRLMKSLEIYRKAK